MSTVSDGAGFAGAGPCGILAGRSTPERGQASGDEPLGQVARRRNAVAADAPVLWAEVEIDETAPAVCLHREIEREMAPDKSLAHGA